MSKNDSSEVVGAVIGKLAAVPLGALLFWFTWNHFTDPSSPMQWLPVFLTFSIISVCGWGIMGIVWLVRR